MMVLPIAKLIDALTTKRMMCEVSIKADTNCSTEKFRPEKAVANRLENHSREPLA